MHACAEGQGGQSDLSGLSGKSDQFGPSGPSGQAGPAGWDAVLARYLSPVQCARLRGARVGLAGAGGLGSNCAMLLARSGIGHLVIADFDVVSLSNLNRQYFLPCHLGQPKVDALADMLLRINPDIQLELHRLRLEASTVSSLFKGCDLVVEAVDEVATKKMLLETLIPAQFFVVGASGLGGWGGGPMMCRTLAGRAVIVGDGTSGVAEDLPPLAPRVMMAAAMQADQVLLRLLGPCSGFDMPATVSSFPA